MSNTRKARSAPAAPETIRDLTASELRVLRECAGDLTRAQQEAQRAVVAWQRVRALVTGEDPSVEIDLQAGTLVRKGAR